MFVVSWPPCTHLAASGARWWAAKGNRALNEALGIVRACLRVAGRTPMVMENPVGRLSTYYRKPDVIVDPWEFAALSGPEDAYTKKTCLWLSHGARAPIRYPWAGPIDTQRIHWISPGPRRAELRSVTPMGLARAIFRANLPVAHARGVALSR